MKSKQLTFFSVGLVIVLLVIVTGIWGIGTYDEVKVLNESVEQTCTQLKNKYEKKANLISDLKDVISNYNDFNKEVQADIADLREKIIHYKFSSLILEDPETFQDFQLLHSRMEKSLKRLLIIVENYPAIKANENFIRLRALLDGIESRIVVDTKNFNQAVQNYNVLIAKFPASLLTSMFDFEQKQYFLLIPVPDDIRK
jgi:LemA protein